jgi:hypothetical protein
MLTDHNLVYFYLNAKGFRVALVDDVLSIDCTTEAVHYLLTGMNLHAESGKWTATVAGNCKFTLVFVGDWIAE